MSLKSATLASAITTYAAIDTKAANGWAQLCLGLMVELEAAALKNDGSAPALTCCKASIKREEEAYKATLKSGAKALPGAWRSAKCVALAAVKAGIALVDASGKARGKTEVEEELKAAKVEKTPAEKFRVIMASAMSVLEQFQADPAALADATDAREEVRALAEAVTLLVVSCGGK